MSSMVRAATRRASVTGLARSFARQAVAPYRALAGNRALACVVAGQACSTLGDWLFTVAIAVLTYTITRSAVAVSVLTFVRLLPYLTVLPAASMLLDRWDRRWILTGGNLGQALCMVGLALLPWSRGVGLAFPLVFVSGALSSLLSPAVKSAVPVVAPEGALVRANSLVSQVDSLGHVMGPALAGLLVAVGLGRVSFLVSAGAFVLAAAVLALVGRLATRPTGASERETEAGRWHELAAGFRFLFRENDGVLAACVATIGGLTLLGGGYWTLAVVFSVGIFHLGGQGTGYLEAVYGAGGMIAGLALGTLGRREHARRTFILGTVASGTAAVLFGLSPVAGVGFLCMMAMGVADVLAEVNAVTLVQASAPVEVVGRALGALEATMVAAMLLGALIVSPLIALLGPRGATVALALIGLGVLALCLPRLRRLDDALAVRLFLRAVPLFARLSLATLDRLGSYLALEEHATGAAIVRQGEPGDKLYIVETGDLAVFARAAGDAEGKDGQPVNVLGVMDYFGEIALLRDAPRNATVRALGPVRLYSLRRADFQWLLARSAELRAALVATEAERNTQRDQVLLTRPR